MNDEEKKAILASCLTWKCDLCGCEGLHACTGAPIIWTEDDKARLTKALDEIFFKREKKKEQNKD